MEGFPFVVNGYGQVILPNVVVKNAPRGYHTPGLDPTLALLMRMQTSLDIADKGGIIDPGHVGAINVVANKVTKGAVGMTVPQAKAFKKSHR